MPKLAKGFSTADSEVILLSILAGAQILNVPVSVEVPYSDTKTTMTNSGNRRKYVEEFLFGRPGKVEGVVRQLALHKGLGRDELIARYAQIKTFFLQELDGPPSLTEEAFIKSFATGGVEGNEASGLEEPFMQVGLNCVSIREITIRGTDPKPVLWLPNGAGIAAEGGNAEIRIAQDVLVEPGVTLVAPQGQAITIGRGSKLLKDTQLVGNIEVGRDTILDGVYTGETLIGDGTTFTRGSKTVVNNSILVPRIIRTRGKGGEVEEKAVPVRVNQATTINNSVVTGSLIFQDAVLLDSVLDLGLVGNHSMLSRSQFAGGTPVNRAVAAHHNDLTSLFLIPLAQRRDLSIPEQRRSFEQELMALHYGVLVEQKVDTVLPGDTHAVQPLEQLTIELDGQLMKVSVKSSNLGAAVVTSNFDPRNDGVKAPSIMWGDWAGVGAIFSAPVEVGAGAGISNNTVVSGPQALADGTLVLPQGIAAPDQAIKPGYLTQTRGTLGRGVERNIRTRMQAIRLLEVQTKVAAAGVARAATGQQRKGFLKKAERLLAFQHEAVADLNRYLALVKESVSSLAEQLKATPASQLVRARLAEQRRVLKGSYKRPAHQSLQIAEDAVKGAQTGLEENGTPEAGRAALVDFVAKHQDTIDLLTEGRLDPVNLEEYFPEADLQKLAQDTGYRQGLVFSLPRAGLPSAFLERGIPVFVQEKWRDQVKASLKQAVEQGAVRFVDNNPAEAYLVIGEEKSIPLQSGQVFIGVNEQTVSRVTPGLLQDLQQRGLLEPGSVVILYRAPKDSVLIFA